MENSIIVTSETATNRLNISRTDIETITRSMDTTRAGIEIKTSRMDSFLVGPTIETEVRLEALKQDTDLVVPDSTDRSTEDKQTGREDKEITEICRTV